MIDRRSIKRVSCVGALALTWLFVACGSSSFDEGGDLRKGRSAASTGSGSPSSIPQAGNSGSDVPSGSPPPSSVVSEDGGVVTTDAGSTGATTPITLTSLRTNCRLINGANADTDSTSRTQSDANMKMSEFGIPVANTDTDDLFFFFGDTAGVQNVWQWAKESLPKAVGYAGSGLSATKGDPTKLCGNLRIIKANGTDFAAGAVGDPPTGSLADYVRNPAGPRGKNAWPHIPGDAEVPTGAFYWSGTKAIYIFHSTVDGPNIPPTMQASYLAKWANPGRNNMPNYQILYRVDERFDGNGQLRGDFINIAPVIYNDSIYLFGTGTLRHSSIMLAKKPLANLETPGGFQRYDASAGWVSGTQQTAPIIDSTNVGELSVQYIQELDQFVMLTQEATFLIARFAKAPEGPWSKPVTVAVMNDPAFYSVYCCSNHNCTGSQLIDCDQGKNNGGLYAPYLFPNARMQGANAFDLSFTISTFRPYNVALMTASFTR